MAACATGIAFAAPYPGVGRTATPAEIAAWDIDVRPDFKGLPPGSGSVAQGQKVWDAKCASCHGTFGESNDVFTPLVGGTTPQDIQAGRVRTLVTGDVSRTTLMKLSTLSTLWDYIRRAMPWNAPKSLSVDEVYAVVAYLLNLGDILPNEFVLSNDNMAQVQSRLPNRDGMTTRHGLSSVKGTPDVRNPACMKDCPAEAKPTSSLPEHSGDSHGNFADQNRGVGGVRGTAPTGATAVSAAPGKAAPRLPATLAREAGCLACHQRDRTLVGPAFKEVASRYKADAGAEAKLMDKVRQGGSGAWGATPMPPNPGLSLEDARALVRWVLSGAV